MLASENLNLLLDAPPSIDTCNVAVSLAIEGLVSVASAKGNNMKKILGFICCGPWLIHWNAPEGRENCLGFEFQKVTTDLT